MMRKLCSLILSASLLTGCATYKVPTSKYMPEKGDQYYETRKKAVESKIYDFIPYKREQLAPYDPRWISWALLGNDTDGVFGEWNRTPYSTNITAATFLSWSVLRNPLHNFTARVIGSKDWKEHSNLSLIGIGGKRPIRALSISSDWKKGDEPFFDIGFNDYKPYFKLNPLFTDFYFGWRKDGSFEIKFRSDFKKLKKKKQIKH